MPFGDYIRPTTIPAIPERKPKLEEVKERYERGELSERARRAYEEMVKAKKEIKPWYKFYPGALAETTEEIGKEITRDALEAAKTIRYAGKIEEKPWKVPWVGDVYSYQKKLQTRLEAGKSLKRALGETLGEIVWDVPIVYGVGKGAIKAATKLVRPLLKGVVTKGVTKSIVKKLPSILTREVVGPPAKKPLIKLPKFLYKPIGKPPVKTPVKPLKVPEKPEPLVKEAGEFVKKATENPKLIKKYAPDWTDIEEHLILDKYIDDIIKGKGLTKTELRLRKFLKATKAHDDELVARTISDRFARGKLPKRIDDYLTEFGQPVRDLETGEVRQILGGDNPRTFHIEVLRGLIDKRKEQLMDFYFQAKRIKPPPIKVSPTKPPVVKPTAIELPPEQLELGLLTKPAKPIFKEPTIAKYLTPSWRYARTLGVYDLLEPSIKGKTAMTIHRAGIFKMLDKAGKRIHKLEHTHYPTKLWASIKNKPTKAKEKWFDLLDTFETAKEAKLKGEAADLFTSMRTLTQDMLARTNVVRVKAGLEPIPGLKSYVTHLADVGTRAKIRAKYPIPEELKYWLDYIDPKHIYNPTAFKRLLAERPGLLKDPIKALKAMTSMDLRQIYLEQPNLLFGEQMKALRKVIPASTREWTEIYMKQVIRGFPTKLDNLSNATLNKLGVVKVLDGILKPFGRRLGFNPIKQITGNISRLVHDAVIWGRIKLVIRNHTQKFLTLGLYDTRSFLKAMLPANKGLKALIKNNPFYKISSRQFMERLPVGALAKLEKWGFKPYGWSHVSNVNFSMKAAYHAGMRLVKRSAKLARLGKPDKFKWTMDDVMKEMEYGAMTTQYWYNIMGMPEVFRSGATRALTVLQSWWMNYTGSFWREMLARFWTGKTGWGKAIPARWRIGAGRHIVTSILWIEGVRRALGLDYKRTALLGVFPAFLSPPGQITLGLYNYLMALRDDNEWRRKKAATQIKSSFTAFIPGSLAWKEYWAAFKGEMSMKRLFFYPKKEEGAKIKAPSGVGVPGKGFGGYTK